MILNSIFCRDEFPNVPKYAYDDRLTKLTVFGGWYSWQKEPRAAHRFFLFQIKKRNLQINKNGHFEKKGNFREPVAKFDK